MCARNDRIRADKPPQLGQVPASLHVHQLHVVLMEMGGEAPVGDAVAAAQARLAEGGVEAGGAALLAAVRLGQEVAEFRWSPW
jgi:hypothetical protein